MKKEILGAKAPNQPCTDNKCPFHGQVNVKKEVYTGIVIKKDAHRSATIEWKHRHYVPKYERYEVRRSRLRVHNPACVNAQIGQEVVAAKTHPLSKTKNHVIIRINNPEKKNESS